ncbi:MAG TPA: hypothetical protein VJC16_07015 [Candidatus Nanoarchaeia archaeon]|nr:hypothetical protein [Candidatus Nanoarchaeia archaeon]
MFRKKESDVQRAVEKIRHADELASIRWSALRLEWLAAAAKQKMGSHPLPVVRQQYSGHAAALVDHVQDIRRGLEYFDSCVKNQGNKQMHHLQGIFQGLSSKGKQISEQAGQMRLIHAIHPEISDITELSRKVVASAGIIMKGHLRR